MPTHLFKFTALQADLSAMVHTLRSNPAREYLWPVALMTDAELASLAVRLHRTGWECLAMQLRCDMPVYAAFELLDVSADLCELIGITRSWVQLCDEQRIWAYRVLTAAEDTDLLLLQRLHSALVGHFYFQHPGLETIAAHEVRFRP